MPTLAEISALLPSDSFRLYKLTRAQAPITSNRKRYVNSLKTALRILPYFPLAYLPKSGRRPIVLLVLVYVSLKNGETAQRFCDIEGDFGYCFVAHAQK